MEELRFSPTDGETFRRVWERVMPDQSLSPVVIREEQLMTLPAVNQPPKDHYIAGLEAIMDGTRGWQLQWERLAQRQSGKTAIALRGLATGEMRQLRRLFTLYYLLTGGNYCPKSVKLVEILPLRDSLRQGFSQQITWEHQCHHMTQRLEGASLVELAEALVEGSLEQSRQMRGLLETTLPQRR